MKIDLFCELPLPPMHGNAHGGGHGPGRAPEQAYEDFFTVVRAADRLGFGAVWLPEHHFLGDYSSVSAPDLLLAALARETAHIELGVAIWPLPIHEPIRIAERLATLDLLSGGRVKWGVGRGVTTTELEGFGEDPATSREVFLERLDDLRLLLDDGSFTRAGKAYEINPPPSKRLRDGWIAAVSPETFDLAADLGLDVLTGPFKPWPMIAADLRRYRRLRPQGKVSFAMACHCDDDHTRARERAEKGLVWAYKRIFQVAEGVLKKQVQGYEHYRRLGWLVPVLERVVSLATLEAMGLAAVGDVAHVGKRLGELRDAGVDRVSLILGGGDLTAEEQIRSLELIAAEIMPGLADDNEDSAGQRRASA